MNVAVFESSGIPTYPLLALASNIGCWFIGDGAATRRIPLVACRSGIALVEATIRFIRRSAAGWARGGLAFAGFGSG
jgi:hypothetical protein